MRRARKIQFLERLPYRRRRLRDAARILPVLGALLMLLPALWSPREEGLRSLSSDVIYFFVIWVLLVALAAAFAPGLARRGRNDDDD